MTHVAKPKTVVDLGGAILDMKVEKWKNHHLCGKQKMSP